MARRVRGRKPSRSKRLVPFGREPVKDRPTAKESRGEINAIRKYGQTEEYRGRYGGGWTRTKRDSGRA